jgi:hypothetical protein
MRSAKVHAIDGGHLILPLPKAISLVLAPLEPLFSHWVWCYAQFSFLGGMLGFGVRTVAFAFTKHRAE